MKFIFESCLKAVFRDFFYKLILQILYFENYLLLMLLNSQQVSLVIFSAAKSKIIEIRACRRSEQSDIKDTWLQDWSEPKNNWEVIGNGNCKIWFGILLPLFWSWVTLRFSKFFTGWWPGSGWRSTRKQHAIWNEKEEKEEILEKNFPTAWKFIEIITVIH